MAVLKKYAVFSGRAGRTEFWMFQLVNIIISVVLSVVDSIVFDTSPSGAGVLSSIYGLAVLLPSIGVAIRRLHDTNRSGWWLLLVLVPIVGWIVLIYFYVQDSTPGDNQYGHNPKGVQTAQ